MKWSTNPIKLQRAIKNLPNGTEEELLAEYRRIGGLVIESEVPGAVSEKKASSTKAKEVESVAPTSSIFKS
jgi:hypothetical protein